MERYEEWVGRLEMKAHPEGGYYGETYRSADVIPREVLASGYAGPRNISTAIYFLLPSSQVSCFHRIAFDELWHFHTGAPLHLYLLLPTGVHVLKLGPDFSAGESFQVTVPANTWFGGIVPASDSFALCSCTVAPGFDFADFELAKRDQLLLEFPLFEKEILLLTKA